MCVSGLTRLSCVHAHTCFVVFPLLLNLPKATAHEVLLDHGWESPVGLDPSGVGAVIVLWSVQCL